MPIQLGIHVAQPSAVRPKIGAVAAMHVLRVFVSEEGEWGNRLGVFLDGDAVSGPQRQQVAAELGFSETVFVEDPGAGRMRIYAPATEMAFAGHPAVGTAWLLAELGVAVESLRLPAGDAPVRHYGATTHVAGRPEWVAPFDYRQLDTLAAVRGLVAAEQAVNTFAWAWIDESAGTIRARSFVPEAGIAEDEATGSAALSLCARLGRPIVVHQGRGSVIQCRPQREGWIEVGGRVVLDQIRHVSVRSGAKQTKASESR